MNFSDKLKKYFEETPREQIQKDWEESAKYDEVGIKISDMVICTNCVYHKGKSYHDKMYCRDCRQMDRFKKKTDE